MQRAKIQGKNRKRKFLHFDFYLRLFNFWSSLEISLLGSKVMNKGSKLGVVIVAAGTSQRMAGINKLFAPLRGKPLLAWSVDTCQRYSLVQQIVLVLNDEDLAWGQKLKKERGWSKVTLCRVAHGDRIR